MMQIDEFVEEIKLLIKKYKLDSRIEIAKDYSEISMHREMLKRKPEYVESCYIRLVVCNKKRITKPQSGYRS